MSFWDWVKSLVTSEDYPQGDASGCKDQAKEWQALADDLKKLKDDAKSAQSLSLSGFIDGAYREGLDPYFKELIDNIDALIANFESLAERLDHVGDEIKNTKIRFWIDVAFFASNLLVFTGPAAALAGMALRTALKALSKKAVESVLLKKLTTALVKKEVERVVPKLLSKDFAKTVGKQAAFGAGFSAANEAAHQGALLATHTAIDPHTGKPTSKFDLGATVKAGASGAIMGGIGGGAISKFAPMAKNIGQGLAIHTAGNFVGTMGGAAAVGDIKSWDDFKQQAASAAAMSALYGGQGVAGERMAGHFEHNSDPPGPPPSGEKVYPEGHGQAPAHAPVQVEQTHEAPVQTHHTPAAAEAPAQGSMDGGLLHSAGQSNQAAAVGGAKPSAPVSAPEPAAQRPAEPVSRGAGVEAVRPGAGPEGPPSGPPLKATPVSDASLSAHSSEVNADARSMPSVAESANAGAPEGAVKVTDGAVPAGNTEATAGSVKVPEVAAPAAGVPAADLAGSTEVRAPQPHPVEPAHTGGPQVTHGQVESSAAPVDSGHSGAQPTGPGAAGDPRQVSSGGGDRPAAPDAGRPAADTGKPAPENNRGSGPEAGKSSGPEAVKAVGKSAAGIGSGETAGGRVSAETGKSGPSGAHEGKLRSDSSVPAQHLEEPTRGGKDPHGAGLADDRGMSGQHAEVGTQAEAAGTDSGLSAAKRDEIIAMEKGTRPDPSTYLPAEYINAHLEQFHDGVARFMTQENLEAFGIGQRDGTSFVMPKSEADALMAATGGEPRALENALGLPEGFLDTNKLVRVDIPGPDKYDLRMPSGNEAGANDQWLPGGRLPDGAREAIIDGGRVPHDDYKVTDLDAVREGHRGPDEHRESSAPSHRDDAQPSGIGEEARADDGRIKISGHGTYNPEHGTVVVPEGTSVTVYGEHGARITDSLGHRIETGQDVSGVYSRTYNAGEEMPNYTLHPPDGLDVHGTPHTVESATQLRDLLTENMGPVDWAACVEAALTPEYADAPGRHMSYGVDGVGNKVTGTKTFYEQPDTQPPGTRGPVDDHQTTRAQDHDRDPSTDPHRQRDEAQRIVDSLEADRTAAEQGATKQYLEAVHEKAQSVREKWDELTPEQRDAVLAHETRDGHRTKMADLDGLPAHVRDTLNRHNLVEDMVARHSDETMKQAVRDYAHAMDAHLANPHEVPRPGPFDPTGEKPSLLNRVASLFNDNAPYKNVDATWHAVYGPDATTGPVRQLLTYDPTAFHGDGRIAVAVGDLDAARVVSVHTPGITSTIRSIEGNLVNAENHHLLANKRQPGQPNSVVAWIGYDAPSGLGLARTPSDHLARLGGARLAHDVASLAGLKGDGARINMFGHSYGSTTTAFAGEHGRLVGYAESVTLLGSPGAGPLHRASDFGIGAENVFVASNSHDLVTWLGGSQDGHYNRISGRLHLGGLGFDPAMREFGATRIAAEYVSAEHTKGLITAHVDYFSTEHFNAKGENVPLRIDPHARPTESLSNFVDISTGDTHRLTLEAPDPRTPIPVGPDQHGRVGSHHDVAAFRSADPPTGYTGPGECVPSVLQDLGGSHVHQVPPEHVSAGGTPRAVFEEAMGTRLREGAAADIIAATGRSEQVVVVHTYAGAGLSEGHPGAHTFLVKPNPHDPMHPLVVDRQSGATHPWPPRDLDRVARTELATFHPDGTPTHPMTPQERQTHVQQSGDPQRLGQTPPPARPESEPAAARPDRPGAGTPDHRAGITGEQPAKIDTENAPHDSTQPEHDRTPEHERPPNADDPAGVQPDTADITNSDDAPARPGPVEVIMPVLERHGVTLDEFIQWQAKAAEIGRDELANHFTTEQLQTMYEARMSHPHPDLNDVIQKVVADGVVKSILNQVANPGAEYSTNPHYHADDAGGCISVKSDAAGLRTPADLLRALRLDYGEWSPYEVFTTTDHAYIVEGQARTGEFTVPNGRIAGHLGITDHRSRDLRDGDPPHTATGYTGDKNGLNPEYQLTDGKWKPGATLVRIDADGSRHPVAVLDESGNTWASAKQPGDHVVDGWPQHKGGEWVFPDSPQHGPHPEPPDTSADPTHRGSPPDHDLANIGPPLNPHTRAVAADAFGRAAFETDAGAAFFDPSDAPMRSAAGDVPRYPGEFTVDVHGDQHSVSVWDSAGSQHRLSAHDFAELIRADTRWDGQSPIRLLACDTGGGSHSFAAELAHELGVSVTAPDRQVWTFPDGREPVTTGFDRGVDGERVPRIPPDGSWNRFHPDGSVERVRTGPTGEQHRGNLDEAASRSARTEDESAPRRPAESVDVDQVRSDMPDRTMGPPDRFLDSPGDPALVNDPRLHPDDLPIHAPQHSAGVAEGPTVADSGAITTRFDDGTERVEFPGDRVVTSFADGTAFTEWTPREVTAGDGSTVIRTESLLTYPGEPPHGVARSQVGDNVARWELENGRSYHAEAIVRQDFGEGQRPSAENTAATTVGNQAGIVRDDGGHMIAYRYMQDQGYRNLNPQDLNLNRGAFKRFENEVAHIIEVGAPDVAMEVTGTGPDPIRPERLEISYGTTIDGKFIERTERFRNQSGEQFPRRYYDGRAAQ